jgi:DNA-binding CsgD family transcriptional regulator
MGINFLVQAQKQSPKTAPYSQSDIENLYNHCIRVREDTVSRIFISYLDKHHIRKENVPAFYAFCKDFKTYCEKQNNQSLSRRIEIIDAYGHIRFEKATAQQAIKILEALHEKYTDQKDYDAALVCLLELSQYLHAQDDKIKALQILFYGEKFAVKHHLQQKISYHGILDRIGYKLWQLDKPLASIQYFKRGLATGLALNRDSLIAFNGIGMNYQKLDSLPQSLYHFNEASKVALADNNEVFNTVVLGSKAVTLLKMGELEKAYTYSVQYKNLSIKYPLWDNAVDAFNNLIKIELKRNNLAHSKILLDSLNGIMNKISPTDYVSLSRHKEAAWLFYEKQQQFSEALAAYKEYVRFDSFLQDYANKNKISELELNAQVRIYEENMTEKERAREARRLVEIAIVCIVVLLLFCLAVWAYRRYKKVQNQKHEIEVVSQNQVIEIEILKKQLLNQLNAIRTHNDSYIALNAKNTGEFLNTNDILEEISKENGLDSQTTQIQLLKAFDLTQKKHWQVFKESFKAAYPKFEQDIVVKTGTLSQAELRLMMLLKLELNNKEIAHTLLITIDGVKKAKYRLYKKIGVTSSSEMDAFLNHTN